MISFRQGPLWPLLGPHSLGATGVKLFTTSDATRCASGKKGFMLAWKKQAIKVGGEIAIDGVETYG